ncbi:hypothetical protein SPBR_01479 [Sporothrix brasiliensis 5110]|uniref:Uncharacterized protein n=1 Tax=Sporothrix brasiliensis 5110 TaxID=1398154 RepID=A0A0C2IS31_9PEZI|nr:uncharacterized protein SPBR_01479 [Sporothrix brasiliensis 5110]KIH91846.1 hypothetical protein SPBR_01479 [Sporothrix brasiliensis 5110]
MTYAMDRDSRRERGQWRGCHTFSNIICDGDAPSNNVPRSGGLKMGQTYYYYYEVDGSIESHDPAVPSTTACPYLPGQRVNTLWVPIEQSSRQRSASVNSLHQSNFQTMNPADKFVTPRPPPATPSVVNTLPPPASAMAIPNERMQVVSSGGNNIRPESPLPSSRYLLRHQRSVRSLSPSASLSMWSPRRLFVRRTSPSREVKTADEQEVEEEEKEGPPFVPSSFGSENDTHLHRPVLSSRLASSSSASSITSVSRLRHGALAPKAYYPPSASQGSRSRDISPESLRCFLVDDAPLESLTGDNTSTVPAVAVDTNMAGQGSSFFLSETDDEDEDDGKDDDKDDDNTQDFDDLIDDDEHNFATSTTSETAPMTILSPPPSRIITPKTQEKEKVVDVVAARPLPEAPTRAPPAIPKPMAELAAAAAVGASGLPVETAEEVAAEPPTVEDTMLLETLDLPQLNLDLEFPPMLAPPSPMSLSPMSMSMSTSSMGAASFQSHEDDSDGVDAASSAPSARGPDALFLPPLELPFQGERSKAAASESQHHHHDQYHHRHHLVAAALTGSTATLVPGHGLIGAGSSSGLDDLVDELGWMATAIQG